VNFNEQCFCVLLCDVQLDSFVAVYETEQSRSIVDPSTKTTFESAPVRKGLMGLAKDMQRLANLSIAPTDEMKVLRHSYSYRERERECVCYNMYVY
jgi:hypothetical protein